MNIENYIYLMIIFLGFIAFCTSILFINKRYRIMNYYSCLTFYLVAMAFFLIFSKTIHIIIDGDIASIDLLTSNRLVDILNFIYSGYSFIGGYIGILIYLYLYQKFTKTKKIDVMTLLIPSVLIMYSILKIGCYVKGCCYGRIDIPVQIIETITNFLAYLFIVLLHKSKKEFVGYSLISFGLLRFVISLFRVFNSIYTLIFIELFCALLMFVGFNILKSKKEIE